MDTKVIRLNKLLTLSFCLIFLVNFTRAQEGTGLYSSLYTDETFNSKSIDLSLPLGIIEAQQSESSTGAATYSIPIKVAPGTGGMVPSISINYNSQSSNGKVGYGWEIGGISAIARAHATKYYDGDNSGISENSLDQFTLNGQRLVKCISTSIVFRTESTDFSYVEPIGNIPSNYDWFKLVSKSGTVTNFGSTQNSRVLTNTSSNHTMIWYADKIIDEVGNYMTYKYSNINGEKLLSEINYTGNTSPLPDNINT